VPISAADVARLLVAVGVGRVILVDVHSGQIQRFFWAEGACRRIGGESCGCLTEKDPIEGHRGGLT
jgi:hypothetical protein